MTEGQTEARIDDLYSRAEELEAQADARLDALKDYIDEEEAEIKQLHYDALKMVVEARNLEETIARV